MKIINILFYIIQDEAKAISTGFVQREPRTGAPASQETEADTRQVNLTRFSLHFPEKRDFFLDGANYFNFGIAGEMRNRYSRRLIPFFSRRLGLDRTGEPLPVYAGE